LVCFSQNHDQVGNRATGDRLTSTLSVEKLKIAAAVVLLGPWVPLLFMGEEWGSAAPFQYFTDHQEPELQAAVRDGRRQEFAAFGWDPAEVPDPGDAATLERSRPDWAERTRGQHAELFDWYRRLLVLRGESAGASSGPLSNTRVRYDEAEGWLEFTRGSLVVCCQFRAGARRWRLPKQRVVAASGEVRQLGELSEIDGPCVLIGVDPNAETT
jgi:maltooligosyltrehalose trehalohydrolase